METKLVQKESDLIELNKAIAGQEQMIDTLREQAQNQNSELRKMQELMRLEFENLATRLLDEKSKHFVQQNQEQLQLVLNPLREKIQDFERKVEHFYIDENKQRATLSEQIRTLTDLNKMVTEEAQNLSKALKGESKVQGNWGEMILERLLEKSGLTKGREYTTQQAFSGEDGKRKQPDLIIHLPMNRHLIIDAKVSLTAYERYSSCTNEADKQRFLKEHIISIRQHLEELSLKNYQQLYELNSLDFVLMFVPIEPAFFLALQSEQDFFYEALDKNILPVSPSTLLATLRTVSNLWRQEQQNKNAIQIAQQGGLLYDKFVTWLEELELVGKRMESTQHAYQDAMRRLGTGRGNLMQSAQRLKELGAKVSKSLPEHHLSDEEELDIL
jgi:DNA recombination protein RmuC